MTYFLIGNRKQDFWKKVSFYISVTSVTILTMWVLMTWIYPVGRDPNLTTINRPADNKKIQYIEKHLDKLDLQIHKLQIDQELLYQWIKEGQEYNKGRVKFK